MSEFSDKLFYFVTVAIPLLILAAITVAEAVSNKKSSRRETQANSTTTVQPSTTPPGSEILHNTLSFLTDQPFNEFDWALSKVSFTNMRRTVQLRVFKEKYDIF